MKSPRCWPLPAVILLVFLAGGVVGGVATHQYLNYEFRQSLKPGKFAADVNRELQKRLKLTTDQRARTEVVVNEMAERIGEHLSKALHASISDAVAAGRRIDQELTPEQKKIHAVMKQEFRDSTRQAFNIEVPAE